MSIKKICSIQIDDRIFNRSAILKTAYLYTDNFYVYMEYAREHIVRISLEAKPDCEDKDVDKKFSNELLAQMLRYQIAVDSKHVKELVIGRALYSTCVDTSDTPIPFDNTISSSQLSLDDIAVDWFDVYEKENSSL